ncbi:MAG TPA: dienelactone hydrolase family protein [Pseudonocardiaceae bacterium]
MTVQPTPVSFASTGITLARHLRIPEGADPLPALVFTGPFTGVKEQVTGHYAAALAQRGYVTLAFDHRNIDASEGQPRQHEDAAGKLAELTDATSYLATHPAVDPQRIGCVGICLGGGYALQHGRLRPQGGRAGPGRRRLQQPR